VSIAAPVGTEAPVEQVRARAFTVPTDSPESDGTLSWDSTTVVFAHVRAGGREGLGWTYGESAAAALIEGPLAGAVEGREALDVQGAWAAMVAALRNNGRPGLSSMAIAAVDVALWDLKARLLELPLARLLGRFHDGVPVYGSGGFTSYDDRQLASQLAGWVEGGIPRVKMKVGREPRRDLRRVEVARAAVGEDVELMVDANGAYDRAPALRWAERFAERGVTWLEEPVSSDDVAGMALVRDRAPRGLEIAAGEYVWRECDALALAGAVDVLQVDVTRCGGVTSTLRIDALARAHSLPTSIHCAPAVSAHVGAAMATLRHLEYFHDHVRIERMLFDGAPDVGPGGVLTPSPDRPGLGLELRRADAERWRA
jgi:L-alanine-DL-glutamate epimerase-like enolase superfamily enzyme